MNANELADELDRFESFNGDVFFGTCAVTLRQQQADYEELKSLCQKVHLMLEESEAEIEVLKVELEKSAEVNRLLAEDIGYE